MYALDHINDVWGHLVEDIVDRPELPSRNGPMREMMACQFALTCPQNNILTIPARKFSVGYASAELIWYLSGSSSVEPIARYAPSYRKFAENNGEVHGAYGPRLVDQLTAIRTILRNDPDSRQAVLSIWKARDLDYAKGATPNPKKDIPCTLSLQFMVRDGELHLFVNMRSNDLWLGMPNDVFCWTTLQILLAEDLGLKVGKYFHSAASMHIYESNHSKAWTAYTEWCERGIGNSENCKRYEPILVNDFSKARTELCFAEAWVRRNAGDSLRAMESIAPFKGTRIEALFSEAMFALKEPGHDSLDHP